MFWVLVLDLGFGFGFRFRVSGHVTRTLRLSRCIVLITWPIQAIGFS